MNTPVTPQPHTAPPRLQRLLRSLVWLVRRLWALPATALGLLLALPALLLGGQPCWVDGVLEVSGGKLARALQSLPGRTLGLCEIEAITFGHVVLGQSHAVLTRLRTHEHTHVRQYERWGAALLLAYPVCSLWQALHGRDPYRDNPFEREAFRVAAKPQPTAALPDRPCRTNQG